MLMHGEETIHTEDTNLQQSKMEKDPPAIAKARRRPLSRASTASIHSVSTQPSLEQAFGDDTQVYHGQWAGNLHSHAKGLMGPHHMSPEDAILQAAPHIHPSAPGPRDFAVDTSIDASMAHSVPYQHDGSFARHDVSASLSMNDLGNFADPDSQMLDAKNDDAALPMQPVQKNTTRTANNEREMQQLYMANKHRSLQDVARELHGNERGPNSERQRQVFAMLWISQVCARGKGSVPRARVYANYASRCANERITVLNPASFGKLVRVLFPGLKTRRLGVRGESKYHYVNFTLLEDQAELPEPEIQPLALPDGPSFSQSFNSFSAPSAEGAADKPSVPAPQKQGSIEPQPARKPVTSSHSLYNLPEVTTVDQLHSTSTKTPLEMALLPPSEERISATETIVLPKIEPFLPDGTDPDAAKSLAALYRSHCTSLVECIRYCKEKTFFHLYSCFQGTLTAPVQRLFGSPAVAPWIEECDFILYQRMAQIVSSLTLQVVPKPVLDTLRNISERLVPHIRASFQDQPAHVTRAKEAPATIFAALINRALHVNLTAHAAANMLANPANRDQMYHDWISMVRIRKVAECVPSRGMDDLVKLLLSEIRDLLDPVNVQWDLECLTIYGDVASRSERNSSQDESSGAGSSNVLDRWVAFLRSLPARFPYATATDIVWAVERVGTAVMRDLTMAQGKSFGSWWVTKCWIDEMVNFMAAHGGFMGQRTAGAALAATKPATTNEEPNKARRCSTDSADFPVAANLQAQADKNGIPQRDGTGQENVNGDANTHDDSGIGIRTPEDEFPMDKYGFTGPEDTSLLPGETIQQHASGI